MKRTLLAIMPAMVALLLMTSACTTSSLTPDTAKKKLLGKWKITAITSWDAWYQFEADGTLKTISKTPEMEEVRDFRWEVSEVSDNKVVFIIDGEPVFFEAEFISDDQFRLRGLPP
ncbi:MAG: hypothetical protein JXR40_04965, partial [Pontiellaceae bacterium]|nr:hypothetical protein [Pontiellaceae bacterium]